MLDEVVTSRREELPITCDLEFSGFESADLRVDVVLMSQRLSALCFVSIRVPIYGGEINMDCHAFSYFEKKQETRF